MKLTKDQVQQILQNKPQGTSDLQILTEMTNQGFEFEGVDMNAARQFAAQQSTQEPTASENINRATFKATGNEGLLGGALKSVGNIPSSGINLARNITKTVTQPVKTVKAVRDVVAGAGAKVAETVFEKTELGQRFLQKANEIRTAKGQEPLKTDELGRLQVEDTPELQTINALGDFIKSRYGSEEALKRTVIEDPVGVLADLSTVLTGGGAALRQVGNVAKLAPVTEAGAITSRIGSTTEPISAITGATKKVTGAIKNTTGGRIVSDVIPTGRDIQRSQVVKALDLNRGDLITISKKTGNDVTDYIVSKGLIKETPEAVADSLNELRKETKAMVRAEVSKVKNIYKPEQLPELRSGLQVILDGIDTIPGLENASAEVRSLIQKKKYTLDDVQRAKELIDENAQIYSKIGDVKSGATARGLDNIRSTLKSFIEDEVSTATNGATDIRTLNNDVQTSYAIEDAINTRATRNLTRKKLSLGDSVVLFGGGATFSPAVGIGLYIGKKIIETPSFRLAFTRALSGQSAKTIKRIVNEVKNKAVSKETQKIINKLADEAKKNIQFIESGSSIVEKAKEKQKQ